MGKHTPNRPTNLDALIDLLAPGARVISIQELPGSFSNATSLVEALQPDGSTLRLVARRYAVFGDYDLAQKAAREFNTCQLLLAHGVPVPQPFYLDQDGEYLGSPGILTGYVSGALVLSPSNPLAWAREMARTLARIHSVPCGAAERAFLLDADQEASWFLGHTEPPDFMKTHPLGVKVWQAANELFPRLQPVNPGLVHVDYWPGNILWENERISAVVDWEEAAYGDPAIDVAYCRMNLFLEDLDRAASEFLTAYKTETGQPVANLSFWELAAAARPMFDPQGWQIADAPRQARFAQFIERALRQ